MVLDPSFVKTAMLVLSGFGAAFVIALWVSLMVWTYRDIRQRSRDPLLRILAVLVVALLFLPGIVIYLILRPPHTLEEDYQHTLEEEALLQSIEDNALCPGCARRVRDDWIACPSCHTRLKKACHQCGKPIELSWNLCPFCATPVPGMRRDNLTMDDALRSLPAEPADPSLSHE